MSLDDEYLRPSIGSIYWFNSQFSDELSSWATKHDITTVRSGWSDFWQHWHQLPIHLEACDLAVARYLAVDQAVEEAEGGSVGSMNDPWPTRNPLRRPEACESWRRISLRLEFWPASPARHN